VPDFSSLPFWLFLPLFIVVLAAAVAIGYLGQRRLRPVVLERGETSPESASVLSAALVLLALLLGFSFSMAMDRYETRRDLVIQLLASSPSIPTGGSEHRHLSIRSLGDSGDRLSALAFQKGRNIGALRYLFVCRIL